MFLKN
jgi:hypothetical protein